MIFLSKREIRWELFAQSRRQCAVLPRKIKALNQAERIICTCNIRDRQFDVWDRGDARGHNTSKKYLSAVIPLRSPRNLITEKFERRLRAATRVDGDSSSDVRESTARGNCEYRRREWENSLVAIVGDNFPRYLQQDWGEFKLVAALSYNMNEKKRPLSFYWI